MSLSRPAPIDKSHDLTSFDCGAKALNHQNRSARTYVVSKDAKLVGYYTLANGSVGRTELPPGMAQGLGNYPVPITLLARLAVEISEKGKGLGRALLNDAVLRVFQASELVGSRAIATRAKDEAAKAFYRRFDFVPSPLNDLHLYLLMKDVRAIVES